LLDGGHWLLETNLDEVVELVRDFLGRTIASCPKPRLGSTNEPAAKFSFDRDAHQPMRN
jgi:hypothetical protein